MPDSNLLVRATSGAIRRTRAIFSVQPPSGKPIDEFVLKFQKPM
jgi:hypothetical protein